MWSKQVRCFIFSVCLGLKACVLWAQGIYPVQVTTQLLPPYAVYLGDYATASSEKLRVILLQRDLSQASYQLWLQVSIELNGKVVIRSRPSFTPPPLTVAPGVPTLISGTDLAPYLDSRNLDFVGINAQQYEQTKSLPEGAYKICFTAYDYQRRTVALSDQSQGCSFYYLAKNEPPLLSLPANNVRIPRTDPAQNTPIVFSWTPRNTASVNSAADTEYELSLYEIRPKGRNPNDIVASSRPVFTTRTDLTQFVYGAAEPVLLDSMQYVWRVRAIDKTGRDAFRNQGFSAVSTFTYGGTASDGSFQVGVVKDFTVSVQSERRARFSWTAESKSFDSYDVFYRRVGKSNEWFPLRVNTGTQNTVSAFDLEADSDYEARMQGKKTGTSGNYSELVTFHTPAPKVVSCGQPSATDSLFQSQVPWIGAMVGDEFEAGGFWIRIEELESLPQDGFYSGYGSMSMKMLGGARFKVRFEGVFLNENHYLAGQAGKVYVLTKGVDAMADSQLANQKIRQITRQQQLNREQWKDTDFYPQILKYDDMVIANVVVEPNGGLLITDSEGKTYRDAQYQTIHTGNPDKAVIIQDKKGDQWVVDKNGTVSKVPAGGLPPLNTQNVSTQIANLIQKALNQLSQEAKDRHTTYKKAFEQSQALSLPVASAAMPAAATRFSYVTLSTTPLQTVNEEEVNSLKGTDKQIIQQSISLSDARLYYYRNLVLMQLPQAYATTEQRKILALTLWLDDSATSLAIELDKQTQAGKSETEQLNFAKNAIQYSITQATLQILKRQQTNK